MLNVNEDRDKSQTPIVPRSFVIDHLQGDVVVARCAQKVKTTVLRYS